MAAQEEEKSMAGLLRRSLAQDAGAGSREGCPDPGILAAYFDHALDAQETARYDLHFSRCSLCREQLAAMARAGGLDGAEKKTASGWDWLTGPRWLMPAAAALVALFVSTGIALRMRKPAAPANDIAMSRPDAVTPEAAPSPDVALPAPRNELSVRPLAPNQHETSRAKSRADTAARREALSSAGAASANSPARREAQPRTVAPQRSPGMARGVLRVGSGSGVAGAAVGSANETVTVTEAAPTTDAVAPAVVAPAKKSDAESNTNETNLSVSVQPDEAKQPNAPKAKSAATAPAQSAKAMNLAASEAAGNAAFARMQQAQISSNLKNLQIQTPDSKILWMVAGPGVIEKSEDGGATWKPEYLETHAPIVAGSAPTAKICWVVGGNGTILRTTDGTHWKTISPPAESDFVKVEATDAATATVTAMDERKFSTTDGGKSWNSVE
jgi:hypothetical protein